MTFLSSSLLPYLLATPALLALACKLYVSLTTVYTDENAVDMSNKVVIVTGCNTGIGLYTARSLAKSRAHVIMAVRSMDKGERAKREIELDCWNSKGFAPKITVLPLDLSQLSSVRSFVALFRQLNLPLHVLINNAGVASEASEAKNTENAENADLLEPMFATNHLGHYLLTKELLPLLKQSGTVEDPSRVVIVASEAHRMVSHDLSVENLERYTKLPMVKSSAIASVSALKQYGFTKLCNVYHAQHLAESLKQEGTNNVVVLSLHPGAIRSDLNRSVFEMPLLSRMVMVPLLMLAQFMFFKSTKAGAQTSIFAATSPDAVKYSGQYLDDLKPKPVTSQAQDKGIQQKLIELSEKHIKEE